MPLKKIILVITLLVLIHFVKAQDLSYQWSAGMGANLSDFGQSLVVDNNGDVITAGQFKGLVDFDPGIGVNNITSAGYDDCFIQKLDSDRNLIWALSIGDSAAAISQKSITVDSQNNIYMLGWFNGTVDFDPDPNTSYLLTSTLNTANIFILKLDPNGQMLWAHHLGISTSAAYDVITDSQDNVCITGFFQGTIDIDPGVGISNLSANGNGDIFILKLNTNGQFIWAHHFGGSSFDYGLALEIDDQDNLYTTGYFQGVADFDPGINSANLTAVGGLDMYLLKLTSNGSYVWAYGFGSTGDDYGNSMVTDLFGNIYITGEFEGTIDFDPGIGTANLTPVLPLETFILKLDTLGNFKWVNGLQTSYFYSDGKITADQFGHVFTTGHYTGTVDFDPSNSTHNITAFGSSDGYIQKLDSLGNLVWVGTFGGIAVDRGYAIFADISNNVFVTGAFQDWSDFDPSLGIDQLSSQGNFDGFVLKLKQCSHSASSIEVNNCNMSSYFSPSGNEWTTPGLYLDTIPNISGCDSVISIDLSFTTIDTTISIEGSTIIANETVASYQWIDCNTDTPIPGATDQHFTPTENGLYSVEIVVNDCVFRSICIAIVNVGIDEQIANPQIYISPNPAQDKIQLIFSSEIENPILEIFDLCGKMVLTQTVQQNESINTDHLTSGLYLVQLKSGQMISSTKLIKQ